MSGGVPYQQRHLWLSLMAVVTGTVLWQGLLVVLVALLLSGTVMHHVPVASRGTFRLLALGLGTGGEVLNLGVLIRLIRRGRPAVADGTWAGIAVLLVLLALFGKFVLVLQDYAQAMRD